MLLLPCVGVLYNDKETIFGSKGGAGNSERISFFCEFYVATRRGFLNSN